MQTLILIAAGIFGLFALVLKFFQPKTSEVLQKNQDVKNEVANLNSQVLNNSQQLANEEAKRAQIEADLKKQEEANATQKDLLDFINNKPSDK